MADNEDEPFREEEDRPRFVDLTRNRIYRVFNNQSFDEGGRFYGGWWQRVPSDYRKFITINWVPTRELEYTFAQRFPLPKERRSLDCCGGYCQAPSCRRRFCSPLRRIAYGSTALESTRSGSNRKQPMVKRKNRTTIFRLLDDIHRFAAPVLCVAWTGHRAQLAFWSSDLMHQSRSDQILSASLWIDLCWQRPSTVHCDLI